MATIQKSIPLTAVDYEILKLCYEYHFLTVSQVTKLRYSSGSYSTCQDRLKRLFQAGVLDRLQLPHIGSGNTEFLYTLSTKGFRELEPLGYANSPRFRPGDTQSLRLYHLQHLISLNDLLISAVLLCRVHPDISISSWLHDLEMKHTPIKVSLDRQTYSIVPDGFLDFRLSIAGRLYAMPVWVEVDRGTSRGHDLTHKLQKIISAIQTLAFSALFGVSSCSVAIATTNDKRVDLMATFIKDQLQSLHLAHLANVFLFAVLPGDIEPVFFTDPVWQTLQGGRVPLLDLTEE